MAIGRYLRRLLARSCANASAVTAFSRVHEILRDTGVRVKTPPREMPPDTGVQARLYPKLPPRPPAAARNMPEPAQVRGLLVQAWVVLWECLEGDCLRCPCSRAYGPQPSVCVCVCVWERGRAGHEGMHLGAAHDPLCNSRSSDS